MIKWGSDGSQLQAINELKKENTKKNKQKKSKEGILRSLSGKLQSCISYKFLGGQLFCEHYFKKLDEIWDCSLFH